MQGVASLHELFFPLQHPRVSVCPVPDLHRQVIFFFFEGIPITASCNGIQRRSWKGCTCWYLEMGMGSYALDSNNTEIGELSR